MWNCRSARLRLHRERPPQESCVSKTPPRPVFSGCAQRSCVCIHHRQESLFRFYDSTPPENCLSLCFSVTSACPEWPGDRSIQAFPRLNLDLLLCSLLLCCAAEKTFGDTKLFFYSPPAPAHPMPRRRAPVGVPQGRTADLLRHLEEYAETHERRCRRGHLCWGREGVLGVFSLRMFSKDLKGPNR